MEKLFIILAWPYLRFFEWLRDHPRRFVPPAAPAPGDVRRHDGSGRAWPVESSRLDALRTLAAEARRCHHPAGQLCHHAAELPSAADALAAYGEQDGKHTEAGAPWRHVPADWTPPVGQRWVRARTENTQAITARQIEDAFAGAR